MLFKNTHKQVDEPEEDVDENYNPEDETLAYTGEKKLKLPTQPLVTGEENQNELATFRCKLYRWAQEQWKERGAGDLKIQEDKESKKVRVLLRQDKTHKIVSHFYVYGDKLCQLSKMKTNEKTWIWNCVDYSDDEAKYEQQAGRFTSKEEFERFQKEFENAYKLNQVSMANTEKDKKEEAKSDDKEKIEKPAEQKPEEKATEQKPEEKTEEKASEGDKPKEAEAKKE